MLHPSPAPTCRSVARTGHAANEHVPAYGCWRERLPSSLMPRADGGLGAGGEIQGDLMQQMCSAVKEPAGSYLLQKLYITWAQEQGRGEDDSFSR